MHRQFFNPKKIGVPSTSFTLATYSLNCLCTRALVDYFPVLLWPLFKQHRLGREARLVMLRY